MPDTAQPPITEPAPQWELRLQLEDLQDTQILARRLAAQFIAGDLLVLSGGLGAGKTTFTQALAEALDVAGAVSSPTFILSRIHPAQGEGPDLVHVDAYRTDAEGLESLDLLATQPMAITVVEWGRGRIEEQLCGPEGSWLDLELHSNGAGLVSRGALSGHGDLSNSGAVADSSEHQSRSSRAAAAHDDAADDDAGRVSVSRGRSVSAGIQTDFSESEEDIVGTSRTAVLRGYGPRWDLDRHVVDHLGDFTTPS